MKPELQALLDEWYTGRDARGQESARFAHRWRDTRVRGMTARSYVPHLADLATHVRRQSSAYAVRVRIAAGVDGQDDIRIEEQDVGAAPIAVLRQELAMLHTGTPQLVTVSDPRTVDPAQLGATAVTRWRPQGGLDHVVEHHGARRGDRVKPDELLRRADKAVNARADVADANRDELHVKANDLRAYRAHLREIAEAHADAGLVLDAAVAAQVSDVETKLTEVNDEKTTRKAVERAARIAFSEARAAIMAGDPNAKVDEVDGVAVKIGSFVDGTFVGEEVVGG